MQLVVLGTDNKKITVFIHLGNARIEYRDRKYEVEDIESNSKPELNYVIVVTK